jgi:signal transduction histidine kinase
MRARLTLWYVSVLALVLIAFSVVLYILTAKSLYDGLDDDLRLSLESVAVTLVREVSEHKPEQQAFVDALNELSTREAVAIYSVDGQLIAEQPAHGQIHAPLPPLDAIPAKEILLYTETANAVIREDRRIAAQRTYTVARPVPYIVVVSQSFDSVIDGLGTTRDMLFIVVPGALIISALGGWFLARRSLAPVVAMSEHAHRIGAENLEQRLPVTNPRDELGRLAAIQCAARAARRIFSQQRRFMADASHELRTPLSVMRTATDVTLERATRTEPEYRDALKIIDEQSRRLTHIVEDMFTLALRCRFARAAPERFYLDELLLETARAARVLSERRQVAVIVSDPPETPFHGDESLLRQMILNLLDNAIKHTPAGGAIRLCLEQHDAYCLIEVTDTGDGIPCEAQPYIFERFYRVDKARSRAGTDRITGSGAGLGLAISRWIAEAHGGSLKLQRSDQTGSSFVAFLPTTKDSQ